MSWLMSDAMVRGYASLPFSPGPVEEYSGVTSSDGEPSAQSSGNPTQQAYCAPDKMTKFSRLSRYGMTFKPLTDDRGEELLTLYLAAFHAKTSAPQERGQESTESDPGCGHIWQELLARYDQSTSLWRTPQSSLLGDYTEFSETWPRWGSMQNGVSYRRQTLVPPTNETESGLWPTPIAQDAKHSGYAPSGPGKADKLSYAVVRWPTPRSNDAEKRGNFDEMNPRNGLPGAVKRWPTPTAHNAKEGAHPSEFTRNTPTLTAQANWPTPVKSDYATRRPTKNWKGSSDLPSVVWTANGGTENPDKPPAKLNPVWVEWLMGWPLGWTDLKPLATDKFRWWQQQHGVSSSEET
jgi:hypothetical protein